MGDRLLHILHAFDGKDIVQKFRIKILLPGLFSGNDGSRRLVQAKLHRPFPVGDQALVKHGQKRGSDCLVHQQNLLGVADAGAAGFGVFHDVQRHVQVGGLLHIYVADAGAGGDAGHGGGAYTGVDQPRAAPGNQKVNIAARGHQRRGAFPGGVLHQIHRVLRNPHRFKTGAEGVHDGVGAAECLLPASQDADVPAFQRQSGGVTGDIGAAFVDNGNDAHGDGHLLNFQAVRPGVGLQNPPHRVRQRRHLPDALSHPGNALLCQLQSVQHDRGDMRLRGFHVQCVRAENCVLPGNQCVRHGDQRGVLLLRGQASDFPFCRLGGFQHFFHKRSSENVVPTAFPSRMS